MLNRTLGAVLVLGAVVGFAGLGANPAQAQCNNGGYSRASYGTYYQPRAYYSAPTYYAPPPVVCYDTPRYRSHSVSVSIGGHHHDRARYQHRSYSHRDDRHDRSHRRHR